ncbi:MAG: hypothetical protein R3A52_14505 [Polyangiales bacterium]
MSRDDEAFLEVDADLDPAVDPREDPTPELPPVDEDDAFLEVIDAPSPSQRARVVSDEDLRVVIALADDACPLLAALWPSRLALAADPPSEDALRERVGFARTTLNRVTRRGAEWRARAEVASASLSRRLSALGARDDVGVALPAAVSELVAFHKRALATRVRDEGGDERALYAAEAKRLREEARSRGLDDAALAEACASVGVALHEDTAAPWTPCVALPDAPRTLDAVAAQLASPSPQCLAALIDGSIAAWLAANHAPDALVEVAREAAALAGRDPDAAEVARWSLAWALGREGVAVDGVVVTSPETLRQHLRGGRLDDARVAAMGSVLARWFRDAGHGAVGSACEALAKGEAHAAMRLRWALGEPLRLAGRAVDDPARLARESLARRECRAEALSLWRSGALVAWLDALPRAKRDPVWRDALATTTAGDERAFWEGAYRRAPRAALRVAVEAAGETRVVRFDGVSALRSTMRVAVAWGALREARRAGELSAWLAVAAPDVEVDDDPSADDDVGLNRALWSLGHAGLVLGWGAAGLGVTSPSDLVAAWKRGPAQLEAQVALGHVGAWLSRAHADAGVAGMTLARAVALWGEDLGAGATTPGVAALRVALLCGLDALPADPRSSGGPRGARFSGWTSIDPDRRDPSAWKELFEAEGSPLAQHTALLWAVRHAPSLAPVVARVAAGETVPKSELREAMEATGAPVASNALADALAEERRRAEAEGERRRLEAEADRLAAEREAARVALEGAEREAEAARARLRFEAEREAARREVARELERAVTERESTRASLRWELERAEAARALREAEQARALATVTAERDVASARLAALEAERGASSTSLDEALRSAARRAAEEAAARVIADDEAARREALERAAREAAEVVAREEAARVAEAARRVDEVRRDVEARVAALVAEEEAARRAYEARVEEEARHAEALAAEEARRAEADARTEAEAESERAAKEAALESEWRAERARAEGELDRLAEAVVRARAEAKALADEAAAPDAVDEEAEAEALREALDGVVESDEAPEVEVDDLSDVEPDAWRVEVDRLAESYALTDDDALSPLREALARWASSREGHPMASALRDAAEVAAAQAEPAFEVFVATRFESRALTLDDAPPGDDPVEVPPDAVGDDGAVDPWAVALPPAQTWGHWSATLPLALPAREAPCAACDGGVATCTSCEGAGTIQCKACSGRARARCPRCAGGGEVATPAGDARCPVCAGRGDLRCEACELGRVPCVPCEGRGGDPCAACEGVGRVKRAPSLVQSVTGVSARALVAGELPDAVRALIAAGDAEAEPVVYVEADEVDPAALAREIPHRALAAALADLMAAEAARAGEGRRVVRQRVVVRRYPVARASWAVEGASHEVVVHGARGAVWAARTPFEAWADARLDEARSAMARDAVEDAIAPRAHGGRGRPGAPGRVGLRGVPRRGGGGARASRRARAGARGGGGGDLPEVGGVRGAAGRGRARARATSRRPRGVGIGGGGAYVLREGPSRALRGEPHGAREGGADSADGAELAGALGARVADDARALLSRGELTAARAMLRAVEGVTFAAFTAAVAEVDAAVTRAERRARWAGVLPWVIAAALALALLVTALR